MNKDNDRVVLVTGASSGIGRACANHLCRRGYRVYGTSRRPSRATEGVESERADPAPLVMIQMDVDSDISVQQGIGSVLEGEGRLDVVVNNAGFGFAGAVEDTSIEEAKSQFETNFFGALRVCRAVLPVMREQRAGYIVNISSVAGVIGAPFQGLYSASKFALEGMTEVLRMEVRPFGVHVVLIEPGDFHTQFTAHRRQVAAFQQGSAYREQLEKTLEVIEADEADGPSPDRIAHLLERIINTPSPRPRYPIGPVYERLAIILKKALPSRLFEWGLMKYYRLL
jgi:NAD(P)-dependent dehydrogenase (short-subunit alcohol dehydrogenase family)